MMNKNWAAKSRVIMTAPLTHLSRRQLDGQPGKTWRLYSIEIYRGLLN